MQLRKASRKQVKLKVALSGPSGSGKTKSALLLAFGMTGDWSKIALIDSENGSAELYSDLGDFNVLPLTAPFTPERYIQAINVCAAESSIEVIIIDSLSHEWNGQGGILEEKDSAPPGANSFAAWKTLTPRDNAFVNAILAVDRHVIGTFRVKQDYVLETNAKGKQVPRKVGLKPITREGMDYEFGLVFDIDAQHLAIASKDRTGLFAGVPSLRLTPEHGELLKAWAATGIDEVAAAVAELADAPAVAPVWNRYPHLQTNTAFKEACAARKAQLAPAEATANA